MNDRNGMDELDDVGEADRLAQRKALVRLCAKTTAQLAFLGLTMWALAYTLSAPGIHGTLRALAVLGILAQTLFVGRTGIRWLALAIHRWSEGHVPCFEVTGTTWIPAFSAIAAFAFGIPCVGTDPHLGVALLMVGSGCVGAFIRELIGIHQGTECRLAHHRRELAIEQMLRTTCGGANDTPDEDDERDPNDTLDEEPKPFPLNRMDLKSVFGKPS